MKNNKVFRGIISYLAAAIIAFAVYYFTLPAINLQSTGFYTFLIFLIILFSLPLVLGILTERDSDTVYRKRSPRVLINAKLPFKYNRKALKITLIAIAVPIAVLIIGSIISSTLFNAKSYANVIDVENAVFEEDMPETDEVTNIALMDSESAAIIGARALGSLSHVVSQFEISDVYTQINYQRTPQKVANLEYAGFFKWLNNKKSGIPGYVMVDPVNNTSKYVELEKTMKYVESGFFGDDLMRKLRFEYPTKILGEPKFELDDEGNPVYLVPCYRPKVMLFGAEDVTEVIIFDPCTGSSEIYSTANTPSWVDIVYDGYLASEKYNWKGAYSGGFFNSIIGNEGCTVTTDDFGYLVIEDDIWYFTGVTSFNSDMSNIGFVLSNARTGEYKFYSVIGAEEHSAMKAAEGEVQEKGYKASFPALINVAGEATYIMVLKDSGGLVKLYALVNVEKYSVVATATTQDEVMKSYKKLLVENELISSDDLPDTDTEKEANITVSDIKLINMSGETVVYIEALLKGERVFFKKSVSADETLLFIQKGDELAVKYNSTDINSIYELVSYTVKP